MDIRKRGKYLKGLLLLFLSVVLVFGYLYAKDNPNQQVETTTIKNLQQVETLLQEGLAYLETDAFNQAKAKFEEALKIAPETMKKQIKDLIARSEDIAGRKETLTKEILPKSEKEAKALAELKQNIIKFEREQKKQAYLTQGKLYFDKGEYEQALLEFNKIFVISPQDKDAIANIEKTDSAIEKDKQMQVKRIQEYRENAKSYYISKKYDSAIDELEKIIAVNPADAEALEYIEEIKLSKPEMDEYKRLEDMVNKGKEYSKDKEYDKAIQIWKQVLRERQDYPGIEVLIGQAEIAKAKSGMKISGEKYKSEREKKMLEIDEAFVPVIGGVKEEMEKKTEVDEEVLAIEKIKKTLKEKKVTLEFTDADLRSVIIFLSRQSGVNMMIDESIFALGAIPVAGAGAGFDPRGGGGAPPGAIAGGPGAGGATVTPYNVTASLRDISLMDALSLILRSRGLDYEIYPNVIWISSQDRIMNVPMEALETRIFDLQFGGPIRGQLRPEPLQLETISFGESSGGTSGGTSGGGR